MGLFKKKKSDFVDLGEHYKKQQARVNNLREGGSESSSNSFNSGYADMSSNSSSEGSSSSGSESSGGMFGIFGSAEVGRAETASSASENSNSGYADFSSGSSSFGSGEVDERRKKLTKRILDMTEKLESISNQLYRLQQRVEVLERKSGVGSSGGY